MYPTEHFHLNFPSISKNSTYSLLWWLKLPSTQLPEPETSGSATIPFSLQHVYISHKVLSCLVPSNLSNLSTFLYLHITTFRKLLTISHLVILWLSLPNPPLPYLCHGHFSRVWIWSPSCPSCTPSLGPLPLKTQSNLLNMSYKTASFGPISPLQLNLLLLHQFLPRCAIPQTQKHFNICLLFNWNDPLLSPWLPLSFLHGWTQMSILPRCLPWPPQTWLDGTSFCYSTC